MQSRWSDRIAKKLKALELLVYASRLIGEEPKLVLWGGGNSSAKLKGKDHLGRQIPILWIKGSGSDMRTITASQFTPLRLEDLLSLIERVHMTDEEMVAYQRCCVLNPSAPKPSIETLLHAFLPPLHIYHTHADSICALVDTPDSPAVIRSVYGEDVVLIPYIRPGFQLAKLVGQAYHRSPRPRAIILDKHGLVTWGDTPKEAYLQTIKMVTEAETFIRKASASVIGLTNRQPSLLSASVRRRQASSVAPLLRGALSQNQRVVLSHDDSSNVLDFVNSAGARELSQVGPFTPDHILHTKAIPLWLRLPQTESIEATGSAIREQVEGYRKKYRDYFERYKSPGVVMLDPNPRVILIPGLGMFTAGKDPWACRIVHDLYDHTIDVLRAASIVGKYSPLSLKDLCDFEYWPMENYKLTLLPKEKELSRRIALVTGAAGCFGQAISRCLMAEGAVVILTDINKARVNALSAELNTEAGRECTVPFHMDVTSEASVREAFRQAVLRYGGLDILVSNAGIARSSPIADLTLKNWTETLDVNATGHFLVCREAMRVFKQQKLGGSITVIATKNIVAPGKDFGAYSASKAAQAQLARVLAIEGAEFGVRVNMVNPDAVFEGSGLWSNEIRAARAKSYGIPVEKLEEHCVARTLLKVKVSARDVAEAVLFLSSERSSKTTGAMIPVDGGVREAFPR